MHRYFILTGLILVCGFFCGGCVEREMVITSEPSGVEVWVNEQWHGKTPYTLPFKHYGVFSIRLEKQGYYPVYVKEPVDAPFYQHIGPDLVSEALIPATIKDGRNLHYVLRKVEEPDAIDEVVTRAQDMIQTSDPIIQQRREADALRQPKDVPLLPEKDPKRQRELEKERVEDAKAALKAPKPREGKDLDDLEPLEPIK